MKKLVYSILFLIGGTTASFAQVQRNGQVNFGFEVPVPVGDFQTFETGFGGSVIYQREVAENLYLTGSAGYLKFRSKAIVIGSPLRFRTEYIPVKLGAKYFFTNKFYGAAQVGATFGVGNGNDGVAFAYAPGIGVELPLSKRISLDLGVRYEGWSRGEDKTFNSVDPANISFFGFRAGINFGVIR